MSVKCCCVLSRDCSIDSLYIRIRFLCPSVNSDPQWPATLIFVLSGCACASRHIKCVVCCFATASSTQVISLLPHIWYIYLLSKTEYSKKMFSYRFKCIHWEKGTNLAIFNWALLLQMPSVSFPARHRRGWQGSFLRQPKGHYLWGAHFPVSYGRRMGVGERMLWGCQVNRCSFDVSHLSTYEFLGRMDLIGAKVCSLIMSTFLY